MNVVLQIQKLSIPQRWDKSCFFYDNLTIHAAISSLTATYADVHGSAVLHWIEPPSLPWKVFSKQVTLAACCGWNAEALSSKML